VSRLLSADVGISFTGVAGPEELEGQPVGTVYIGIAIKGRPTIDQTGTFELIAPPGFAGSLGDHKSQGGRPPMADKESKRTRARELKERGMSVRDIAEEIGVGSSGKTGRAMPTGKPWKKGQAESRWQAQEVLDFDWRCLLPTVGRDRFGDR